MTKIDAVINITKERIARKWSRASMLRLEKSLTVLGLDDVERADCMRQFDYWDANNKPYPQYAVGGKGTR